jgi:acyl-CoA dehydrogenase
MAEYNAPLQDMGFVIHELAALDGLQKFDVFAEATDDLVEQILDEAAKFARDVWAPTNVVGDEQGIRVEDKTVIVPDGFAEAYQQYVEGGWPSLEFSPDYGGMGFPGLVGSAVSEMLQSANLAFSLCPMLTGGAIHALDAHASDELNQLYLPKMVSGEWTGTMCLTEAQAGSDLSVVKTKAVPDGDAYRIIGTKIFITWGDQEISENVIHLVLARLPDAPDGVRGISLFLVPKYLVNPDGSVGDRNDVFAESTEHKLGIHASPTVVMNFGDGDGAIGYLVGEENKGLACMFTMMNHARVGVGIQGLAVAERAYQLALEFAKERVQGVAPGIKGRTTIVHHADVRRMLMVMKSQIEAMRAVAYVSAADWDVAHNADDSSERGRANERVALVTPVVKGWMTEVAQEVTSLGVQVQGGMGYVEETGAAQHMRDARILPIYEGTTGIQALDLAGRKILGDSGKAMQDLVREMRSLDAELDTVSADLGDTRSLLSAAVDELERSANWLIKNAPDNPHVPGAASVNLMMQMGTAIGGWQMARAAVAAGRKLQNCEDHERGFYEAKTVTARFYMEHILPRATAYARAACAGSESTMGVPIDLL